MDLDLLGELCFIVWGVTRFGSERLGAERLGARLRLGGAERAGAVTLGALARGADVVGVLTVGRLGTTRVTRAGAEFLMRSPFDLRLVDRTSGCFSRLIDNSGTARTSVFARFSRREVFRSLLRLPVSRIVELRRLFREVSRDLSSRFTALTGPWSTVTRLRPEGSERITRRDKSA
jgi:hypothetical protein